MSNDFYTDADAGADEDGTRRPALARSISFPAYAASTALDPQPVWRTLNAARERNYTGEIVVESEPETRLYLDHGVVYFAERGGQPSLGRWLVDVGVLDVTQLERGVVRVGDVEHLGRLFDRDDSIDRDAVVVAVETATSSLVAELANGVTASIRISAYRHHQSGVHRWFVGPLDTSTSRPISAVAQVDRSVVEELPTVGRPPQVVDIRWDEPLLDDLPPFDTFDEPLPPRALGFAFGDDVDQDDPLADRGAVVSIDYTEDASDIFAPIEDAPVVEPAVELSEDDEDFQIHWPDGTEHAPPIDAAPPTSLFGPRDIRDPEVIEPAPVAEPAPSPEQGTIHVDHLPEPDDDVPIDVADAVRRALEAIESAATGPATLPEIEVTPIDLPADESPSPEATTTDAATIGTATPEATTTDAATIGTDIPDATTTDAATFGTDIPEATTTDAATIATATPDARARAVPTTDPPDATTVTTDVVPASDPVSEVPPGAVPAPEVSPFAPPTLDQRAELVYARAVEAAVAAQEAEAAERAEAQAVVVQPTDVRPTGDEVIDHIVDFGDDDHAEASADQESADETLDDGGDRKGALRRLIGSLRRKDG